MKIIKVSLGPESHLDPLRNYIFFCTCWKFEFARTIIVVLCFYTACNEVVVLNWNRTTTWHHNVFFQITMKIIFCCNIFFNWICYIYLDCVAKWFLPFDCWTVCYILNVLFYPRLTLVLFGTGACWRSSLRQRLFCSCLRRRFWLHKLIDHAILTLILVFLLLQLDAFVLPLIQGDILHQSINFRK